MNDLTILASKFETKQFYGNIIAVLLSDSVKEVALSTLKETALAFSFIGITYPFRPSTDMPKIISKTVQSLTTNFFFRIASGFLNHFICLLEKRTHSNLSILHSLVYLFKNAVCGLLFASEIDLKTRQIFIHEGSHALVTKLLYANSRVTMKITSEGGLTRRSGSIREGWNPKLVTNLITLAGPLAQLSCNLTDIGIAHFLQNKQNAIFLNSTALMGLICTLEYAIEPIRNEKLSETHDFKILSNNGIHPGFAITTIAILPIILKLGLYLTTRRLF